MSRETYEVSEEAEQMEWEISHGEVDKNGCYPGEPITHDYPLNRQSAIIWDNESIDWSIPF